MGQRQGMLDWFGGMLDKVPLPVTNSVSSEALRAVLLAVYRIPGEAGGTAGQPCWAGQSSIAAWASQWLQSHGYRGRTMSERTARRALAVLERDLQLIASYRASRPDTRGRRTLDHYVILWSEVGNTLDRSRSVTRPSPTRETPATRPDCEADLGVEPEGSWPVDRPPWPVDRPPWPVDRPPWPVDRRGYCISAHAEYGKEQESNTTAAPPPLPDTDGRADGRTNAGWAAVVEVLREAGVSTAAQRADELRRKRLSVSEALEAVQGLLAIAEANAGRFRAGVGAALAYRLRTGDWPCAVEENVSRAAARVAVERSAAQQAAWNRALDAAYRRVRAETPRGQVVDDGRVVAVAVDLGVPETVAAEARGLLLAGGVRH